MVNTARNSTISGLFWSSIERIGHQGVQVLVSIVLARLLLPTEFGLIAMLTIFIALAQSFVDSGFGSALVQKQDVTHLDECSVFYFNILVGFLVGGLLFLSAPLIGAFYEVPLLVPLARVMSVTFVINAFGVIHTTLLTKRIDFKAQMKVSVIAAMLSGGIGIAMAYRGFGVWSLAAQSISNNLFRTTLLWLFLPWRPSWAFSFISLRSMFTFGSKLLFSGLLDTIYNNLYLVVIGRMFSATTLGYYTQADQAVRFPSGNLSKTIGRVTFPVFSSMQDSPDRLKRATRKTLTSLGMINFPLMIGMAVVAKPLVLVVLTDKWLPCVPFLQLLCIVGLLFPCHVINLNVLMALGRSDLFFRLEIYKKILITAVIFLTAPWGIIPMLYGQIVTSIAAFYMNSFYSGKLINYPTSEQIKDLLPMFFSAVVMGCAVLIAGYLPIQNSVAVLSLETLLGIIVYVGLCSAAKIFSFVEIASIAQNRYRALRQRSNGF
ncbi:MAG: lipopolysaccharide biosynthesis protein [Deltaproteobacteria bacterium]